MRLKLAKRLAARGAPVPVSLVGPDLPCETVEDAERLVARFGFELWLRAFAELSADASTNDNFADLADDANEDDRASLIRLYKIFDKFVVDLKTAIRTTREDGVPWGQTRDMAAEHRACITAARIITEAHHMKKDPP
jgi:hypothetical protein